MLPLPPFTEFTVFTRPDFTDDFECQRLYIGVYRGLQNGLIPPMSALIDASPKKLCSITKYAKCAKQAPHDKEPDVPLLDRNCDRQMHARRVLVDLANSMNELHSVYRTVRGGVDGFMVKS